MSCLRAISVYPSPVSLSLVLVLTVVLAAGCRDYGINEHDSPQIIALKKQGAKVSTTMTGGYNIDLKDAWLDDDDMIHFEELPTVIGVDVSGTDITDEGLVHLAAGSEGLLELKLDKTDVTDAGIETIQGLSRLSFLSLSGTQITDRSLEMIAENHPGIQDLRLIGCEKITNDGLKSIAKLRRLERLLLTECRQITDEGLEHLMGKPGMQIIHLMNTGCTNPAVEKLAKSTGALAVVNAEGQAVGALAQYIQQNQ